MASESVKFTAITMDWTDTGARVMSSLPVPCPACGVVVTPNVEHLCGDRVRKQKPAKKRKGGPNA